MSGIEVVAAVAGIVSAFQAPVSLYKSWRDKRDQRKKESQNQALEHSLCSGATTVQTEYDRDFARLGRPFAVGDGMPPFRGFLCSRYGESGKIPLCHPITAYHHHPSVAAGHND